MNDEILIWENITEKLADVLSTPAFESWIKPLRFVSFEDNILTICAGSNMAKDRVYKNYLDTISSFAEEITGKQIKIKILVEKFENYTQTKINLPGVQALEKPKKEPRKNKNISLSDNQIDSLKSISNNLNIKYTFDTFVVGSHDKFAHAAAHAVAKNPGGYHNPLFIYGGVGLGKTHLMQAIGHYILMNHPELKIKYISSETFTNDLITSLRSNAMPAFRTRYRLMDVLLIDDIQFIEGKESTQEEIFHTFNTLHQMGKQIVLTADRHPKDIPTLTERLKSRFEWGLLADIQTPDLETRIAILKNKVEIEKLNVPDDVLEMIAVAFVNNVRELEGALNRVVAYASINECPVSTETAKNVINTGVGKIITLDKIIEITASYFSVEAADIKGQSRSKEFSHARQIAVYLSRSMTNSSFPAIGNALGKRKHTTILYAYEKMKEELQTNKLLLETVNEISSMITNC